MREIHLKNSLIGIFAVAKITKIHIFIQIEQIQFFSTKFRLFVTVCRYGICWILSHFEIVKMLNLSVGKGQSSENFIAPLCHVQTLIKSYYITFC